MSEANLPAAKRQRVSETGSTSQRETEKEKVVEVAIAQHSVQEIHNIPTTRSSIDEAVVRIAPEPKFPGQHTGVNEEEESRSTAQSTAETVNPALESKAPSSTLVSGINNNNNNNSNNNNNNNINNNNNNNNESASSASLPSTHIHQWPWITLEDVRSKQPYYFNAMTHETVWEIPSDDHPVCSAPAATSSASSSPTAPVTHHAPPHSSLGSTSAQAAASALAVWQEYVTRWKTLQSSSSSSPWMMVGTASLSSSSSVGEEQALQDHATGSSLGEDVNEQQRGPALGMSSGPNVTPQMAVYIEHLKSPTAQQLGRPAKRQVRPPETNVAYTQGSEEYNIWYGKYLSDRWENGKRNDRERAMTRCNPFSDSGWTRADLEAEKMDKPIVCLYFAKGCCYMGSDCRYYHRVPTAEDNDRLDNLHDIFGREKFAHHRDDMSGVGSFSEDCRTLFVGDLKVHRIYPNAEEKTEALIRQQFGVWGPIDEINVIRNRNFAFVRYKLRVSAEFARVAMAEQKLLLDREDDQICVRWAHPGTNTGTKSKAEEEREWELANTAMMTRLENLGYTQDDVESYLRWEIQQSEKEEGSKERVRSRMMSQSTVVGTTSSLVESTSVVTSRYPSLSDDRVMVAVANSSQLQASYPEVKKIIEMTQRYGAMRSHPRKEDGGLYRPPIPLAQQPIIDDNHEMDALTGQGVLQPQNEEGTSDDGKSSRSKAGMGCLPLGGNQQDKQQFDQLSFLESMINQAKEKVAFEDSQKMEKILSRMNFPQSADAFNIDV